MISEENGLNTNIIFNKQLRYIYVVTISVFVFSIILHIAMAFSNSLWMDEFYTIFFIKDGRSISDLLRFCRTTEVTNPPLYYIVMYYLYRVLPHTEGFMRMPSVVFFIIGVFFLVGYVWRISKKEVFPTLMVFCLVPINVFSIGYISGEMRAYAQMFMLACAFLYFRDKLLDTESIVDVVKTGLIVLLLGLTHYAGVIMVSYFGFADIISVVRKKQRKRVLMVYMVPALIICAWLFSALRTSEVDVSVFWADIPDYHDVLRMFSWLFGSKLMCIVVLLGVVILLYKQIKKKDMYENHEIWELIASCVYMIALVYVYSRYVNPKGGIFVARYFVPIMPSAMASVTLVIGKLTHHWYNKKCMGPLILGACVLLMLVPNMERINKRITGDYLIRENASLIRELYEDPETEAIVYDDEVVMEAFVDFYLRDGNYRTIDINDVEQLNQVSKLFAFTASRDDRFEKMDALSGYTVKSYTEGTAVYVYTKEELREYEDAQ